MLTQAAYARRRNVTKSAVHKAVASGRIVLVGGLVDPQQADRDWDESTDPIESAKTADLQRRNRGAGAPGGPPAAPDAPGEGGPASAPARELLAARAQREAALAEIARLDLAARRGELVAAAEVEQALAGRIIGVRDALDALADRLGPVLAAESDARAVTRRLRAELRTVLAQCVADLPENAAC